MENVENTPPDGVMRELFIGYLWIPVPYAKLAASLVGAWIPRVSGVRGNGSWRDATFRSKDGKTRFRAFVAGAPADSVPNGTVAYFWFVDALRDGNWVLVAQYVPDSPSKASNGVAALAKALSETARLCSEAR